MNITAHFEAIELLELSNKRQIRVLQVGDYVMVISRGIVGITPAESRKFMKDGVNI